MTTYKNQCECGREIEVKAEDNPEPEYNVDFKVRCVCGRWVDFVIPFN